MADIIAPDPRQDTKIARSTNRLTKWLLVLTAGIFLMTMALLYTSFFH